MAPSPCAARSAASWSVLAEMNQKADASKTTKARIATSKKVFSPLVGFVPPLSLYRQYVNGQQHSQN